MLIHSLKPVNFRNLASLKVEFSAGTNYLYGGNGHGKTNLLEAIYWIILLRGKRGGRRGSIKRGESFFKLEGELTFGELRHQVELTVEEGSKRLEIDGVVPKRRREYLQEVLAVDFFPEDLLILLLDPSLRRRFLDLSAVQYFLPHEEVLGRYKRLLEVRNSVLKRYPVDLKVLESYDEEFAEAASKITAMRLEILSKLEKRTAEIFREGIGEKYEAALHYRSTIEVGRYDEGSSLEQLRLACLEAIKGSRKRDIEERRTTVGPHLDDWSMSLDGKDVRAFASRGEVRSAMFALQLARFHVLAEKRGIEPVVLIDDVMSELDAERRARVLELLPEGQMFLTSCDPPPAGWLKGADLALFVVENGYVRRVG